MVEFKFNIGDQVRLKKGNTIHTIVKREITIWKAELTNNDDDLGYVTFKEKDITPELEEKLVNKSYSIGYRIQSTIGKGKRQNVTERMICKVN